MKGLCAIGLLALLSAACAAEPSDVVEDLGTEPLVGPVVLVRSDTLFTEQARKRGLLVWNVTLPDSFYRRGRFQPAEQAFKITCLLRDSTGEEQIVCDVTLSRREWEECQGLTVWVNADQAGIQVLDRITIKSFVGVPGRRPALVSESVSLRNPFKGRKVGSESWRDYSSMDVQFLYTVDDQADERGPRLLVHCEALPVPSDVKSDVRR